MIKKTFPIHVAKPYRLNEVLDDFLRAYYSRRLIYLASDMLQQDYEPEDISEALVRAMKVCRQSNMRVEEHFMPLYSSREGSIIRDCKLSLFGYRLVLLNANPDHPATARFQLGILEQIDNKSNRRKQKL